MRAWWLILGGLVVLSSACSDFWVSADAERKMDLQGMVTDASSGTPLEGALVSLEWTLGETGSSSAFRHVDAITSETGTYRIQIRLKEVNCNTLYLFIATGGYDASRRFPECSGGKQVFNVELEPE
jgi:hypothetical protein